MEFQRSVLGLDFAHPLLNGAGVCKRPDGREGSDALARSAAAAVLIGSITRLSREGNAGPNYYYDYVRGVSVNALGLPNGGLPYYETALPEMIGRARTLAPDKPIGVSIAGFTPEDFAVLAEVVQKAGADFLEVNAGCPNVRDGGQMHRIICYDPPVLDASLRALAPVVGNGLPVTVKVSPCLDAFYLRELAMLLASHACVQAVTSMNTLPNGYLPNRGMKSGSVIAAGLGGVAGPAVLATALGQVRQFREALPKHVRVIGVGGVQRGADVQAFLDAGADLVQVVTTLLEEGPSCFARILDEMVQAA